MFDGADGVQQMGACTLSRDAFRFSDGVELKAATQVVCEHVQLLPGAIGGIAFSGHDVESELAAQFGEGFLLAASPSSEVPPLPVWVRGHPTDAHAASGDIDDKQDMVADEPERVHNLDGGAAAGVRDPEVSEKAKRRRFSAEYKLRIVREADACKGDGDVAALLRREGLYSSHLSSWRRQRDEIAKAGLTSRKRGRKAKAEAPRIKELERENARLQRRLARVETMLEIQKKASELLGIPLNPIGDDEND